MDRLIFVPFLIIIKALVVGSCSINTSWPVSSPIWLSKALGMMTPVEFPI